MTVVWVFLILVGVLSFSFIFGAVFGKDEKLSLDPSGERCGACQFPLYLKETGKNEDGVPHVALVCENEGCVRHGNPF